MELLLTKTTDFLVIQSLHLAGLFILIAALAWLLRNQSAHVRYLLWLLILAKCFVPPLMTVPLAVLPDEAPPPRELSAAFTSPAAPTVKPVQPQPSPATFAQPQKTLPQSTTTKQGSRASNLIAQLRQVSMLTWATFLWLGGAALYFLLALAKAARFHLRIRSLRQPVDADLQAKVDTLADGLRMKHPPRLYLLGDISQPFVWGLIRGSIYLPADFVSKLDEGKRLSILLHELSHVRRFDPLLNLLQIVAQGVYWFHPLVWIANHRIRAEREKCCDEAAIAQLQTTPKEYGSAIVEALTMEYRRRLPVPTLAVAGPVKNIEDRIKTIMQPGRRFATRPTVFALLTVLLLATIITPTTIALTERTGKATEEGSQKAEDFKYIATLPYGVTVELVGLGTAPWKTEQQWWTPNGSSLDHPVVKFPYLFKWVDHPDGWQFTCTALCKFSNYTGKEISVPDVEFSNRNLLTRVWGTDFTSDGYEMAYIASNPTIGTTPDKTDIRLAVGSREFVRAKRLGKYNPHQHEIHFLEKNSEQVILHPIRIGSAGTPCVDLTCKQENKEIEFRVFAKLTNGETEQWRGGGVGKDVLFFQSRPKRQNTKAEDIEDIIVEFRPYEWVTFKNVALKPGVETDVTIDYQEAGPASGPGEMTLEKAKQTIAAHWAKRKAKAFTPLEWGQLEHRADNSVALPCKYEVVFWAHPELKEICDSIFFISPDGTVEYIHLQGIQKVNLSVEPGAGQEAPVNGPVDLTPADFDLRFDEKRGVYYLVVSIQNTTDGVLPEHRIRYYRGDPAAGLEETGHPHTGWHIAGPIEPGKTWNERTGGFVLPDGEYEFTVVLDYNQAIAETDEGNNTARLQVTIENGRIAESRKVASPINP